MTESNQQPKQDHKKVKYAGQPTAQGIYEEVQYYLEKMGYLPRGNLDLCLEWENGREIPEGAEIVCAIGCSEPRGVCLEAYLRWRDEEQKKVVNDLFFVSSFKKGKDLNWAAMIASTILKAFCHNIHTNQAKLTKKEGVKYAGSKDMPHTELLLEAAERPGEAGYVMTRLILEEFPVFPLDIYRKACQNAIETADPEKVMFMLEQAESHVEDLPDSFYGDIAECAYQYYPHITQKIIDCCTPRQVEAIPASLLLQAVEYEDTDFACRLAQKGMNAGDSAECIIDSCIDDGLDSLPAELLRLGMRVSPDDYGAMRACLSGNYTEAAAMLLEKGMDFDAFKRWADEKNRCLALNDAYAQVEAMWTRTQSGEEQPGSGQCMG